jgi:HlyD family secretion protein
MARRAAPLRLAGAALLAVLLGVPVVLGLLRGERTVEVELHTVRRGALSSSLSCRGRLVSRDEVSVSSNIVGRVERVLVEEGQAVRRDQPLVILDPQRARSDVAGASSALEEMKAAMANAAAQLQRAEALFRDQLISRADYENRRTDYLLAKARAESAAAGVAAQEKGLEMHTIRAPIDGVVTGLQVKEGSIVVVGSMNNPATVMLTIANLGRLEVALEMNEVDFGRTRLGLPAQVRIPAFADLALTGRIRDYNVKATTRNPGWDNEETFVDVYVALDRVPPQLKPGLTARVDLLLASAQGVLSVPVQAVLKRDPRREARLYREPSPGDAAAAEASAGGGEAELADGVYVVGRNGRLRFEPVAVTLGSAEEVAVTASDLRPGDRVVAGPFSTLKTLRSGLLVKER